MVEGLGVSRSNGSEGPQAKSGRLTISDHFRF